MKVTHFKQKKTLARHKTNRRKVGQMTRKEERTFFGHGFGPNVVKWNDPRPSTGENIEEVDTDKWFE